MLPKWTIIGFTGHRSLTDPKSTAQAIERAVDRLQKGRDMAAVTSAASGADTLFVEEVARRDLPYFLILPFSPARFQEDFSPADWQRVTPLIDKALSVEEVQGVDSPQEAYLETGVRTVDQADVVVAVWNGEPAAGAGGTAEVVAYARSLEKPLILIDSQSGAVREERLDRLPPAQATGDWNAARPHEAALRQFDELDQQASRLAPSARQLVVNIIVLHLLAAGVALTASTLKLGDTVNIVAAVLKLLLLSIALLLVFRHRRTKTQWVEKRIGAELCRAFLAMWRLRRKAMQFPRIPVQGYDDLVRSLKIAWYLDPRAALPLDQASAHYLRDRVEDQLDYFNRNYATAERRAKILKFLSTSATVGAIAFGLCALAISALGYVGWIYLGPKLLSVVLPLIPPAFLSLLMGHDLARRAKRAQELTVKLEDAARRLTHIRTWQSLARIVTDVEETLLLEVFEWHFASQVGGRSH